MVFCNKIVNIMNLPPNSNLSENALYDLKDVETMCRGNKDLILNMIKVFIDQIPKFINELNTAFSDNDFVKIKNEVHKIKPTVHFFGAYKLKEQLLILNDFELNTLSETELKVIVDNSNQYASEVINELKQDFKIK